MTPDERRAQFQAILNRHDDIARALSRITTDAEGAQNGLEQVGRTIRDLSHAVREASAAMLAANRAALALFNQDE